MKHRYVDSHRITSTAGSLATYTYSCNGMFDPNITGTGHQPMYFDQLSAIYNHYTVLNSKISVSCVAIATAAGVIGVYINDDASVVPGTAIGLCEQGTANYRIVNIGTSLPTLSLRRKWSAKQAFGPGAISDPNLQGSASANPTEQQAFTCFVQSIDLSSTFAIDFFVTIEYDCVWQELKDIASS